MITISTKFCMIEFSNFLANEISALQNFSWFFFLENGKKKKLNVFCLPLKVWKLALISLFTKLNSNFTSILLWKLYCVSFFSRRSQTKSLKVSPPGFYSRAAPFCSLYSKSLSEPILLELLLISLPFYIQVQDRPWLKKCFEGPATVGNSPKTWVIFTIFEFCWKWHF